MKKIFLAFFIFGIASFLLSALTLEEVVPSNYVKTLKEKGSVSIVHPKEDFSLSLLPNSAYKKQIEEGRVKKEPKNIPFTAEFLYYVPKSVLIKNSKKGSTKLDIQDVSVIFRSISKMEGMKYHEGKDTLYKKSYNISNPDSDAPIPDQTEGSADGLVTYCYQRDNTYGNTKYKMNYYQNENELCVSFLNILPFGLMGVYPCQPGSLKISILAIDCEDSFVIYMCVDTDCKKVMFLNVRKKMEESITDRLEAIYKWCLVQF